MLFRQAFSRPLHQTHNGEDYISITGQLITGNSKESVGQLLLDESYPLRYQLEKLQRFIAIRLKEMGRPLGKKGPMREFSEVIRAADILRQELIGAIEEIEAEDFTQYEKAESIDERAGGRTDIFGTPIATHMRSALRSWAIDSDPQDIFEFIYDTSDLLQEGSGWTWGDVAGILGLWCIDEAITHINANEPYKAASWAMYADRYEEWQFHYSEWQNDLKNTESQSSAFSRLGLDARHSQNRAVKAAALSLYTSKQWRSQAEAARRISLEVNRTELVVMRWIREYRKGNTSTDTGTSIPEGQ